jgi:hypothetical protein
MYVQSPNATLLLDMPRYPRASLWVLAIVACASTSDAETDAGSTGGGDGDGDGGTCHTIKDADVCPEVLADWIDTGTSSAVSCPSSGGGDGDGEQSECIADPPPSVDPDAAEALCDEVCAQLESQCPCEGGTYDGCTYEGEQADGHHRFRCSFAIGCGAGGCIGE